MKFIHYINKNTALAVSACLMAGAALAMLTACTEIVEVPVPVYTVGEAANAIVLSAGISEGGAGVQTRATRATRAAEDHHSSPGHNTFTSGTKLTLRVDGTWLGKANGSAPHGTISGTIVSQKTTATIGEGVKVGEETANTHNKVTFTTDEQLYWDDYGTADPANMSPEVDNGREKGLTIYGVAVDGVTTAPVVDGTAGKNWTALSWNVGTPSDGVLSQTEGWSAQDLLTSNNITSASGADGTLKFDAVLGKEGYTLSNLLEFTHAMSKITVRLIASEGFPTTGVGHTTNKFASTPEVILTSNEGTTTTNDEWPFTSGNVNVTTGDVTGQDSRAKIKMHAQATPANTYTAIFDALVMPGSTFSADDAIIARINADGNIYYVTAAAIRTKIGELITASKHNNEYKTEPGKNYIITVTVKKTKIEVTATIKAWEDIASEEVNPVINVNNVYGSSENNFGQNQFSFYRSTSLNDGYSSEISKVNNYYPSEATVTKSGSVWNFSTPLYWTNHNTHYQMRGVWPPTVTTDGESVTSPRVETSGDYQVIKVQNVAYVSGSFPSDLAIGRPDVQEDSECTNQEPGHTKTNLYSGGICATEGKINLAFEYMMSKIEVNLSTSTGSDQVELANAVVEVTNLYTTGEIKLGDRGAFTTGSTSTYGMQGVSGTGNENKRMAAIVPQELTYSTEVAKKKDNVRFKITITNNDARLYTYEEYLTIKYPDTITEDQFIALPEEEKTKPATTDIYYADVAPICKLGSTTEKVAPNGKWESGKYYVYNLKLSKTKIDVTATLANWKTVNAEDHIWF